jgi:hypothetical protein
MSPRAVKAETRGPPIRNLIRISFKKGSYALDANLDFRCAQLEAGCISYSWLLSAPALIAVDWILEVAMKAAWR